MTNRQKKYKATLIKSIHTSPLYNEIYKHDRDLYEAMLENRFGVKSSKNLSIDELLSLNAFMNNKGVKKSLPKKVYASENQVSYILTMWEQNSIQKDIFSLMKLVKKVTKNENIDDLKKLSRKQASSVIAAVKNIKPVTAANNTNYKG